MTTYDTALELAAKAHAGQTRFDGSPYLGHPVAVADAVHRLGGTDAQVTAALLHDVVEDTDVTLNDVFLLAGPEVDELVDACTRRQGEIYADFIKRCRRTPDAALVKACDVMHNLTDGDGPPKGLEKRYRRALSILLFKGE